MRASNDHPEGSTRNTHHRALQTTIILAAEARVGAEAARVRSSATRASEEHDEPDAKKSNTTVIVLAVLISLLVLGVGVGVGRADSFPALQAGPLHCGTGQSACVLQLLGHRCSCLGTAAVGWMLAYLRPHRTPQFTAVASRSSRASRAIRLHTHTSGRRR